MWERRGPLNIKANPFLLILTSSADVQRQRISFAAVKARLRTEGLPYAILFPAELRIIHDGKAHFYTNPKEAMALWCFAQVLCPGEEVNDACCLPPYSLQYVKILNNVLRS